MNHIKPKSGLLSAAEHRRRHLPGRPLKVCEDPEVRLFIDLKLETMTFKKTAEACRERFGPERSPSKTSIHRYWLATLRSRSPDLPRLPSANSRGVPKSMSASVMNRLRRFPPEVKREVQRRLTQGDYESLRAFSEELYQRGYSIGKSALARHRRRLLAGREQAP